MILRAGIFSENYSGVCRALQESTTKHLLGFFSADHLLLRKNDCENTSFVRCTANLNFTLVSNSNMFHNCQPQTCPSEAATA